MFGSPGAAETVIKLRLTGLCLGFLCLTVPREPKPCFGLLVARVASFCVLDDLLQSRPEPGVGLLYGLWSGESETTFGAIGLDPGLVLLDTLKEGESEPWLDLLDALGAIGLAPGPVLREGESEPWFDLLDALGSIGLDPSLALLDTLRKGNSEPLLDLLDALGAIGLAPGLVLLDIFREGESETSLDLLDGVEALELDPALVLRAEKSKPWLDLLDALGAIGLDPSLVLLDIPRIGECETWLDLLDALRAIESEPCLVFLGTTGDKAIAFSLVGLIFTGGLNLIFPFVWAVAEEISSVGSFIFQTIPLLASIPT